MSERSGRWFVPFLAVVCLALGAQVVLLVRTNRQLRAVLAQTAQGPPPTARLLAVGDTLPPLELASADGRERLAFDGQQEHLLLLVFADGCPACDDAREDWRTLHRMAPPSARFLGLQIDCAAGRSAADLGFPVMTFAAASDFHEELFQAVPMTLLVDPFGLIEWVSYGPLDNELAAGLRAELEALPVELASVTGR